MIPPLQEVHMAPDAMVELVSYIAKALVDKPDEVSVT